MESRYVGVKELVDLLPPSILVTILQTLIHNEDSTDAVTATFIKIVWDELEGHVGTVKALRLFSMP